MEDQIKLFAERSRRKMNNFSLLFVIFMVFAAVFIYLLSDGDIQGYRDYYISIGAILGIFFVMLLVIYCSSVSKLRKEYQYLTDQKDPVSTVYVSTTIYSEEKYNSYSKEYQKKAEKIANSIPKNLDTQEKVKWIADYLIKHIEVYDFSEWVEETDYGKDKSSLVYEKGIQADTGYGALFYKIASMQGYMEAFGMICAKAGIYTIAAMDKVAFKCWNLVKIDGKWLAVNVGAMAQDKDHWNQYYLISNNQMEKRMDVKGTYGRSKRFQLP